jgi:hypothetical protein
MFGRPGQSVASWELELDELLSVCDDHVSLYQLTLERGMSFLPNTDSFCARYLDVGTGTDEMGERTTGETVAGTPPLHPKQTELTGTEEMEERTTGETVAGTPPLHPQAD